MVGVVSVTTENTGRVFLLLSYGLFRYAVFSLPIAIWKYSILAGAFTLSIMILPSIMRTTQEALFVSAGFIP